MKRPNLPILSMLLVLLFLVVGISLAAGIVNVLYEGSRENLRTDDIADSLLVNLPLLASDLSLSGVCHRVAHLPIAEWLPIILDDCTVDLLGDGSIRVPVEDYLRMEETDWWVNRAARVMVDQHNNGQPMPMEWCLP